MPDAPTHAPDDAPRIRLALRAIAVLFLLAACVHALRALVPSFRDEDPVARHAAFVAINLTAAAGLAFPHRILVVPFFALTVQQILSHGGAAWRAFQSGRLDGISIAIVLLMPATLALLVRVARQRPTTRPS